MKTALISVYHKDGIVEFAKELVGLGFAIYASGGTAKHLASADIKVIDVATLVGGEAILGHRVVTLSREIHAGLLSRDIQEDIDELARLGIPCFDLVCVDLYPLEEEIAKPGSTKESVTEKTDIGGPTLIRSAVKGGRLVICDPNDRQKVIDWLKAGEPDNGFLEQQAAKGEFIVARYIMNSAAYLTHSTTLRVNPEPVEGLSDGKYAGILGEEIASCKYGENAQQSPAGLFSSGTNDSLALDKFKLIEGIAPSYNNWCDIDRMLQTITHIAAAYAKNRNSVPFIAIGVKHGNACGAAVGDSKAEVVKKMMVGDPLAIFGGLIMTNFSVDESVTEHLAGKLLDAIIAPSFSPEAIAALKRKGDKCRFIANETLGSLDEKCLDSALRFRYVRGGFLRQPNYTFVLDLKNEELQKYGMLSQKQENDLLLAWAIGTTSNSNTIAIVKNSQLLGNGVGQQDRVGAAKLAIERAHRSEHNLEGSVAYSDSFFPFPDGPKILIDAGIKAILATSGSIRDKETIDLCREQNVALYMIPDAIGRGFFGH